MSEMLHVMNETTTDVICDLYTSLVDFADDEDLKVWADDFGTELHLGFANSLRWCDINAAGEMMIRSSYIALLQHVGLNSLFVMKNWRDFYNELGWDHSIYE